MIIHHVFVTAHIAGSSELLIFGHDIEQGIRFAIFASGTMSLLLFTSGKRFDSIS